MSSHTTKNQALWEFSNYIHLPGRQQSECAHAVYSAVAKAFDELEAELAATRAELETCRHERMDALQERNRLRNRTKGDES